MKKIALTTREELNIYMNPTRQQLLHQLSISNAPMTPKMLADKLKISASGVQHHIKKLMLLGLIELDHTEAINGITASFYKPAQVMVQVGLGRDDELAPQRNALMQETIAQVYEGFRAELKKRSEMQNCAAPGSFRKWGDIMSGVAYLNEQESEELMIIIDNFILQHASPKEGSNPWEYAIIAYNAAEKQDD